MKGPDEASLVVIGLGSEYRRDDAVGIQVAQRLRGMLPEDVRIWVNPHHPLALWEAWTKARGVVLIDAACPSAQPGTVHRFDAHAHRLPNRLLRSSTHSLDIAAVIELSRTLNQLPPYFVIYAIEGRDFSFGFGLSPEVEAAVPKVIDQVLSELATRQATHGSGRPREQPQPLVPAAAATQELRPGLGYAHAHTRSLK